MNKEKTTKLNTYRISEPHQARRFMALVLGADDWDVLEDIYDGYFEGGEAEEVPVIESGIVLLQTNEDTEGGLDA